MEARQPYQRQAETPPVPVNKQTIWFILLTAFRVEEFFRQCAELLDPEMLDRADELTYRIMWASALELYNQTHQVPTGPALWAQTSSRMRTSEEASSANEQWADEVIREAFDTQLHPQEAIIAGLEPAREFLRALVQQRVVYAATHDFVKVVQSAGDIDADRVVEALESNWRRVGMIAKRESLLAVPTVWDRRGRTKMSTGISWLDQFLGGGCAPGETNVLLGATGVAKTLFCTQMAVSYARYQYEREQETGERGKAVVFIIYEDDGASMQARIMANAAEIPLNTLRNSETYDFLSRPGYLKPYEQEMQRGSEIKLSEFERLQSVQWLNDYIRPVDFGPTPSAEGGHRGIPEIREACDRAVRELDRPLGYIMVDWSGQCMINYLQAKYGNTDALTRELTGFVGAFTRDVVAPHNAVGWAVHQLSGQANKMSPTRLPTHADAQWCSTFAQLAWTCLVLGNKNQDVNACLLGATKARYAAGQSKLICHIRGDYQRLEPANDTLRIDPHTGQFVPITELDKVADSRYNSDVGGNGNGNGNGHSDIDIGP